MVCRKLKCPVCKEKKVRMTMEQKLFCNNCFKYIPIEDYLKHGGRKFERLKLK
jgi:hypothetical protein